MNDMTASTLNIADNRKIANESFEEEKSVQRQREKWNEATGIERGKRRRKKKKEKQEEVKEEKIYFKKLHVIGYSINL